MRSEALILESARLRKATRELLLRGALICGAKIPSYRLSEGLRGQDTPEQ